MRSCVASACAVLTLHGRECLVVRALEWRVAGSIARCERDQSCASTFRGLSWIGHLFYFALFSVVVLAHRRSSFFGEALGRRTRRRWMCIASDTCRTLEGKPQRHRMSSRTHLRLTNRLSLSNMNKPKATWMLSNGYATHMPIA